MNTLGFNKTPQETRVVVAMSGGVDSSVAAALMVEEGYDVIGVTLQLYDYGSAVGKKGTCCAGKDIYDAKNVAHKLNIPHYVFNYESLFREQVIDDFADSYMRGETPIPCVKCNETVKFKDLLQTAKELDADALVTGHYVKRIDANGQIELHVGDDDTRDQSYFLFATTPEQLDYLRFPIGRYTKDKIREVARKLGLSVADKPDSQDICFVPNGSYAKVIEKLRPGALDDGDIVHLDGQKLGRHKGIINYTIGQRRGLGISSSDPLYVIKIDPKTKTVYVGPKEALGKTEVYLTGVNWLGNEEKVCHIKAKIRSTKPAQAAKLYREDNNSARVVFDNPEFAVSPGQACVFYQDTRVLGGGWITRKAS